MKNNWKSITKEDVIKAIEIFNRDNPDYPKPRNTFLIYKNQKLPAKHIRGMAYKVANNKEIRKSEFTGGLETVRFFEGLGFEVEYHGESEYSKKESVIKKKQKRKNTEEDHPIKNNLKIALYLQTDEVKNIKEFDKAIELVKKTDFDILVLPEFSYVPFISLLNNADLCRQEDTEAVHYACLDLSEEIGKAVVVSSIDVYGTIFSVFANAFATDSETQSHMYIKHTATTWSAFDFDKYHEVSKSTFQPIKYKGCKIGMTICYDCNHSIFSRIYGLQDVDIIINSTYGNVVYDKWHKYNKVRAIENNCYNFVTMGGDGRVKNPKAYVYGFNRKGKDLVPYNIVKEGDKLNEPGGIYMYDLAKDDKNASQDPTLYQSETVNKNSQLEITVGDIDEVLNKSEKLIDGIHIYKAEDKNVVFCLVDGNDILKPEKVLKLLYSKELKDIKNKRYIIVNKHKEIDEELYKNKLSILFKVRTMENYCALIVESDNINKCYQTGKNRTAQVVKAVNGKHGVDLSRTTGPEAIWKNKVDTKAKWRDEVEWLIHMMGSNT